MKKIFAFVLLFATLSSYAQKKPVATKKPAAKVSSSTSQQGTLKNLNDSVSYAIGLSVANFYAQQGIKNVNTALLSKAVNDVLSGKKPLLSEADANACMMQVMNRAEAAKAKQQSVKAQPNIQAGEKFLAANKNKPGVKTTESGLQYEVLREGSGIKPAANDTIVAHYAGTLLDGTEFDNSYKRGQPITLTPSQVIRGWTEALQLMPVGSKYKLYIPYELGYGLSEAGAIPPGSVLIFEVELLEVRKAK
jgi:FKBP-type peptidyl-prolyl cis-trans isomerase